jgi:ribosomal protein S18 acetylase RimI-like enzyme
VLRLCAQVHRLMVAEEEFKELKVAALNRRLGRGDPNERSACLVALCPAAQLEGGLGEGPHQLDERLVLGCGGGGSTSSAAGPAAAAAVAAGAAALVGTLDVYAVRALQGEVLIGDSRNAAYLANVCTAGAARRRGVGQALLQEARRIAVGWGEAAEAAANCAACCLMLLDRPTAAAVLRV